MRREGGKRGEREGASDERAIPLAINQRQQKTKKQSTACRRGLVAPQLDTRPRPLPPADSNTTTPAVIPSTVCNFPTLGNAHLRRASAGRRRDALQRRRAPASLSTSPRSPPPRRRRPKYPYSSINVAMPDDGPTDRQWASILLDFSESKKEKLGSGQHPRRYPLKDE